MADVKPIDPRTIRRYGELRRRRFSKEYRFRVLGSLDGKAVLDVGCGEGTNAMNFAKLGAHVTGIDISPKAIELAGRRAEVNGVATRSTFLCSPLETAELAEGSFDIIWGDAILHHLIDDLDGVLSKLVRWAKPGALVMFAEPVNFSPTLRRLRMRLPLTTEATPDERPLERAEIAIIARYLVDLRLRHFSVFGRLDRFVLSDYNYELSATPRRALSSLLASLDYIALSVPVFQPLAGTCVIYGHTEPR